MNLACRHVCNFANSRDGRGGEINLRPPPFTTPTEFPNSQVPVAELDRDCRGDRCRELGSVQQAWTKR